MNVNIAKVYDFADRIDDSPQTRMLNSSYYGSPLHLNDLDGNEFMQSKS